MRECDEAREVISPHIKFEDHVGYIFTKVVHKSIFLHLCSNLGIENIYSPAHEGALKLVRKLWLSIVVD